MIEILEELIDRHNVTNTLEGYPQFCFIQTKFNDMLMYHLQFDRRDRRNNEFIRLFVYPDRVNVTVEYRDRSLLDYLNKKYLSRSTRKFNVSSFDITDKEQLEDFIVNTIEYIIEMHINDAGVV